ncbi:MAG: Asp-tRNA(Asn)/Glu-tRNA(Gln) amidotransferase subunit GatC [Candidatus Sungbacteria bacterium]|uniref:Asp-tRNA(Asn)/Glu-tRNA(Gln) amidotransferase subunit GatC n=1 Tax=Candidatus Sungiibacteriota bacterium TaxID=2750080 RepID=A0A931WNZ1_9BACT|nr:Asp-tRNA(Asn)/Glu-tRNA(Gln) amidotransferase subunit GatC [Candidatus Sungbacteria bacterium]
MSLSRESLEHLADLARIHLAEGELSRFEKELPSLLDFVAALQSVPTDAVIPVTGGTDLTNSLRRDKEVFAPLGDPEDLRTAFSNSDERGYLVVSKIFGYED